jgi:DEAD/DEAH box helicase domain-containing protein
MLPAHLAENIRRQVLYYLQSTFDFRDKEVNEAFEEFLEDPERGIFKGAWVQLRRPFRPAHEGYTLPFDLTVPFHPFVHQSRAWRRLTSKNHKPQATLVTTGTGSGKTECFLYPLLDHCLRAKRAKQKGIKAIVLYPMNALAADQERRFAASIWSDPELKQANIRVGTYTGRYDSANPTSQNSGTTSMGEDHGITNHEAQLDNPPDILLTNYKMLDFLLLRPQDQRLWRFNQPDTLQYLILDELHTYDGAQGADVACLIRRLKERLGISQAKLCVVGTSATMDNRDRSDRASVLSGFASTDSYETGSDRLARFASTLFEEDIPPEAVIVEDRLSVEQIIKPEDKLISLELPSPEECDPLPEEDATAYAIRQAKIWGCTLITSHKDESSPPSLIGKEVGGLSSSYASPDSVKNQLEKWSLGLGDWLKGTKLFKQLLELFDESERSFAEPLTWTKLVEKISTKDFSFIAIPQIEDRKRIITAFFALIAQAKEIRSGRAFPLVPTQVQLWIRELTRVGRVVTHKPEFGWLDEPTPDQHLLPAFHCNECGASGWIGLEDRRYESAIEAKGIQGFKLTDDIKAIYRGWFGRNGTHDPRIVLIVPDPDGAIDSGNLSGNLFGGTYIHPASLVVRRGTGACPITDDTRRVRVAFNKDAKSQNNGKFQGTQVCPCCGTQESIFIIGSRSATLSSVMVDELFGSALNNDPKLLAFTDSVQDASHRAGFLSARTYNFTFRTALQRVIHEAGSDGLTLPSVGKRLLEWWGNPGLGRPGNIKEAISALLPPDLFEYQEYLKYRNNEKQSIPESSLQSDIETRLTWQATSEFGLMLLRGRTMESSGSACLAWDWEKITQAVNYIHERLESVDTRLRELSPANIYRWLLGILYRYRLRGALGHHYLTDLAKRNFWGKKGFHGRAIAEREVYPSASRFRPRLMVTARDNQHDFIFGSTSGNTEPWHIRWTYRALDVPLREPEAIDLLRLLYKAAESSQLLTRLHEDNNKIYYVINLAAARLVANSVRFTCKQTGRQIVRPENEAIFWDNAPSLEYSADKGIYRREDFTRRQIYYQNRYRKGALRRVVANEHTGLLATEEREDLERTFAKSEHADDPNVLTCTSTLEMGIDIGDLSSTMLCSIPPTTASYLQRIGRAGRATGTALIVSVINHQPHDLFFYARPTEMLRGKVDPPGCWVDASAVLVRQYLAYCFDCAVKIGKLVELPGNGVKFVQDMNKKKGHIPHMMAWVGENEEKLQQDFLARFADVVREDTKIRFYSETKTALLIERILKVAREFDRQRREIDNARNRLRDQKSKLDEHEEEARLEIEEELRVLKGRQDSLSRISTLELLTNHGLLPNYAFPETGVHFYGSVYNRYRFGENPVPPIEVVRPAATALRELAPHNYFYTHKRQFKIQQIAVGSKEEPLAETWAICGRCGHMRLTSELQQENVGKDASTACPQCGYDGGSDSQADIGQQRKFIEFARSEAISVMEQYDSLSSDRSEQRENISYQRRRSFDLTVDAPSGAVGEEGLPFGIEYRAGVIVREVNVGFQDENGSVGFGSEGLAPERGFLVCTDCGVVASPGASIDDPKIHRRSCSARRKMEKAKAEGRNSNLFKSESVYLYREIRSEAIRILLPPLSDDDINTLQACFLLGLRLRFEGDPSHLSIFSQQLPDGENNFQRNYLVILDKIPGGTGYLKTLFQQSDSAERAGEGIMAVMRRALDALESCRCRQLGIKESERDTDGCYRCIRTYSQQYNAASISRERGIILLKQLIAAGEKRTIKQALTEIPNTSLLGSLLEQEFLRKLQEWVTEHNGTWEKTIVQGKRGFRFREIKNNRIWELELQPQLAFSQGVNIPCQPDFMLRCPDDNAIKPVAIFTDGFEFHVTNNRLADDMAKRRAILNSGLYHVWSITWDDLKAYNIPELLVVLPAVADKINTLSNVAASRGNEIPSAMSAFSNPWQQLIAYIQKPNAKGWAMLAEMTLAYPLEILANANRTYTEDTLYSALMNWREGEKFTVPTINASGEWVCNHLASSGTDIIAISKKVDCQTKRYNQVRVTARLGDKEIERSSIQSYRYRWRIFLACLNLFQFCGAFNFFTTSEIEAGKTIDVIPDTKTSPASGEWAEVRCEVVSSLQYIIDELAITSVSIPIVAYEDEEINEAAVAELAWVENSPRVAILAGDQVYLTSAWETAGWKVVTANDLQVKGINHLIEILLG